MENSHEKLNPELIEMARKLVMRTTDNMTRDLERSLTGANMKAEEYVSVMIYTLGSIAEHYMSMAMVNMMFNTEPREWTDTLERFKNQVNKYAEGNALDVLMNKNELQDKGLMQSYNLERGERVNNSNANGSGDSGNEHGGSVTHIFGGEGTDQSQAPGATEPSDTEGS
jgi:hypothetical protein